MIEQSKHSNERSKSRREVKLIGMLALVLLLTGMMTGCGGKPFNVREKPFKIREGATMPPPTFDARAEYGPVTIQAEAVTDEDSLYDTFDANLILAGVLPIGVLITNSGQEPLELKKARFEIRAGDGRGFKSTDAKRAFKRLLSYYEISTYSKSGYKESQEDFLSYSLDTSKPLAPAESREGMLFFLIPGEVVKGASITLVVSKLDSKQSKNNGSIELKLK
jgi:hypothetical protein